jgi:hypothetical protein
MAVGFKLAKYWFDQKAVQAAVDGRTRAVLGRYGALVRGYARRSMPRRKNRDLASPSTGGWMGLGKPPYAHLGYMKDMLTFALPPPYRTVVVGPEYLPSSGGCPPGPGIHEKGWSGSLMRLNRRRRLRRIGGVGEIRVQGYGFASSRGAMRYSRAGKAVKLPDGRTVTMIYAPLRTAAQAARSNAIQETLYGPFYRMQHVNYPARPYMRPAGEAVTARLGPLWGPGAATIGAA